MSTQVAGVAGGGATTKAMPGMDMSKMDMSTEECSKHAHTDAGEGASNLGGGPSSGLMAALDQLKKAVQALNDAVAKMSSGNSAAMSGMGVMGEQGAAATKDQYVAPTNTVEVAHTGASEDNNFEQRVLELINAERAKGGLAPVRYSGTLDNAAEKHADHMAIVGKMAHENIGDGDPGERIRAEGFRGAWGENVARGQTSPEQVVREWMNSPEHRRNIMDPNFRQMGVGYVKAANGDRFWAQEFGA